MGLVERRLPLATRTTYSEILERLSGSPLALAGFLGAGGSFVRKTLTGRTYMYYQWRERGRTRQAYLGPVTSNGTEAVGQFTRERRDLQVLLRMILSGGGVGVDAESFRYLQTMATAGIFARGAILVGTHAFITFQNLLGYRWGLDITRTMDVDVAGNPRPEVAVPIEPAIRMQDVLERIDPAVRPLWDILNPSHPPVSFGAPGGLRVDFVTPQVGRPANKPVAIPWLDVHASPVRLLDYLIEAPIQAVALSRRSACLVRVPDPARFAVHKLIVADRREGAFRSKSAKDLRQAEELLVVLYSEDRQGLAAALAALPGRSAPASTLRSLARCEDLPDDLTEWIRVRIGNKQKASSGRREK